MGRARALTATSNDPGERVQVAAWAAGMLRRRDHPTVLSGEPGAQPRLFDAVMFAGEWDLLGHRLDALADVATKTLVVEADRCFSGAPREYELTEAELARRGWSDRIVAHRVVLADALDDPVLAAVLLRDHISELVAELACAGDRVLLCDLDEIPFADSIREPSPQCLALGMRQMLFFANHERIAGTPRFHFGPALVPASALTRRTPSEIRIQACTPSLPNWRDLPYAGVHLQYTATGDLLGPHLKALGHPDPEVDALLAARERVRVGKAMEGYVCLVPEGEQYGEAAAVDEARLAAVLEYVIATSDSRSGRRRTPVPDRFADPAPPD